MDTKKISELSGATYNDDLILLVEDIDGIGKQLKTGLLSVKFTTKDEKNNLDKQINELKDDLLNEKSERTNVDNKILSELLATQRFISSIHSGYTIGTVVLGEDKAIAY